MIDARWKEEPVIVTIRGGPSVSFGQRIAVIRSSPSSDDWVVLGAADAKDIARIILANDAEAAA